MANISLQISIRLFICWTWAFVGFLQSSRAVKSAGSETRVPGAWVQLHYPRTWWPWDMPGFLSREQKRNLCMLYIAGLSPESPSLFFWTLTMMVILTNLMVLNTIYLSINLYICFKYSFIYLAVSSLTCGMWDLSCLDRDRTCIPCFSRWSLTTGQQGSPRSLHVDMTLMNTFVSPLADPPPKAEV